MRCVNGISDFIPNFNEIASIHILFIYGKAMKIALVVVINISFFLLMYHYYLIAKKKLGTKKKLIE